MPTTVASGEPPSARATSATMRAAGSIDPKQVRDALAKVDFPSLYGRVKFMENGQISLPQIVIQIQDGEVAQVYTTDFIKKPKYPLPPWPKR